MTRQIFVFGSNLAGRHGAGSARRAMREHGAVYGVGEGVSGDSYAIPTKDAALRILPLTDIAAAAERFKAYALANPDWTFSMVAVGCGLAGYAPSEIAPMFKDAPENVIQPREFVYHNRKDEP